MSRLGFAWAYDLGTARGQEATPIVVDDAMYTSGTWGYVYALDAATGKELWKFDPRADPRAARNPCCDRISIATTCLGCRKMRQLRLTPPYAPQ